MVIRKWLNGERGLLQFFVLDQLNDGLLWPFCLGFSQKLRSFPPKLFFLKFGCGDRSSSSVRRVVPRRNVKPLTRLGVGLDLSNPIRYECFESFRWGVYPVQRNHRVCPVENIFRFDLVEFLDC